jgi:type IV fimbrial biogenesis protein FimT
MSSLSHAFTGVRRNSGGFTLIELMVTLTLLALLLLLAVPSFTEWVRNNQIRATAESLQNGLRAAKGKATNLNRQVVFVTTNAAPAQNALGATNGLNWYIQYVPYTAGEATTDFYLEGGNFAGGTSGITVTTTPATASICFNSVGRMVANAAPSSSASIPACAVADVAFDVSRTGAVAGKDRPLRVLVSASGQIRMCDPARPSTSPDGCP